jgi:hypothetical protein
VGEGTVKIFAKQSEPTTQTTQLWILLNKLHDTFGVKIDIKIFAIGVVVVQGQEPKVP